MGMFTGARSIELDFTFCLDSFHILFGFKQIGSNGYVSTSFLEVRGFSSDHNGALFTACNIMK